MNKDVRIDFTDGRVFSRNQGLTGTDLDFWKALKLDFPWTWSMMKSIQSEEDLESKLDDSLFFTGSNAQIKYRQEYVQMENGEICECCGVKIQRFPWNTEYRYSSLCDACASRMDKEYGRDMFGMSKRKEAPERHWWLIV